MSFYETNRDLKLIDALTDIAKAIRESDTLALINRQKAEIERLEAETDRLNYLLQCYALEHGTAVDKERFLKPARAEAVKEFAKRLKTKVDIDLCAAIDCSDYLTDDLPKIIDNLVKEFTEGNER